MKDWNQLSDKEKKIKVLKKARINTINSLKKTIPRGSIIDILNQEIDLLDTMIKEIESEK